MTHLFGVLAFAMASGTATPPATPAAASAGSRSPSRWTATIQSGIAQDMQLSLGGLFNQGPAQQNRLTVTRSGILRASDSLQIYGWSTTDVRTGYTDTESGIRYRSPIRNLAQGKLIAGAGLEHWNFPSVLGGTKDAVLDSYLGWSGGERFPVTISGNGKTLLRSDLPRGTFACFQAMHTQKLGSYRDAKFAVQHGPAYIYSWGLYGRNGHRVLRYYGVATVSRGKWAFEGMFRPQQGLQPGIPDNKFWMFSVIRRLL